VIRKQTEMPHGQLERCNEAGSPEVGNSVLRTADEPDNSAVNTREGTEITSSLQQATICSENTATQSSESLRDFIANVFRKLKEDNVKLNK
jgi:hypothetical protein